MASKQIKKWIRIIAAYSLLSTVTGVVFYALVQFRLIEEQLTTRDHIDFFIDTIAGLTIFVGLWKLTTWGWKFTIIFTLISWIYFMSDLFFDYERFMGIFLAPFIIIEALILRYLLSSDVRSFFNISSQFFNRLYWTPAALFLLAVFLIVKDIFDGIVGLVTVIGLYLGLRVSRKYKKKLTSNRI